MTGAARDACKARMRLLMAALLGALAAGAPARAEAAARELALADGTHLTKVQVDQVLATLRARFAPLVAAHGGELVLENRWDLSDLNGSTDQVDGQWIVRVHGGVGESNLLTLDGLTFLACHELGHHLAGYPYYYDFPWPMAAEGSSDWYAAHVCAPLVWRADKASNAKFRSTTPASVRARCDREHQSADDQNLCYRIVMAGKSMLDAFAVEALRSRKPSFDDDEDDLPSSETAPGHGTLQCRLDTIEAGALCTIPPNPDVIPGVALGDDRNTAAAEREAAVWSCMPASAWVGARLYNEQDMPRCWFVPQVTRR